jgi:hypothetical protein
MIELSLGRHWPSPPGHVARPDSVKPQRKCPLRYKFVRHRRALGCARLVLTPKETPQVGYTIEAARPRDDRFGQGQLADRVAHGGRLVALSSGAKHPASQMKPLSSSSFTFLCGPRFAPAGLPTRWGPGNSCGLTRRVVISSSPVRVAPPIPWSCRQRVMRFVN